jgi:superoxide dismutase, Fe-Mn family
MNQFIKMKSNRRTFIKQSTFAGLALLSNKILSHNAITDSLINIGSERLVFSLPPLPYKMDALEPFIDTQTMEIHHGKHHNAYVTNLNKALANSKLTYKSIDDLCQQIKFNTDLTIRNNAGGHYNHSFFWECMQKNTNSDVINMPKGKLSDAINSTFKDFDNFKKLFEEAGLKRFGSGWVWLYEDKGKLKIGSTPNQDNPLMPLSDIKGKPLLALDVWEHAYYLKYQNKRADYMNNWWNIVNWNKVNELYNNK